MSSVPSSEPETSSNETTTRQTAGVILAGGRSRRMGEDKTALRLPGLQGRSLLEWTAERLAAVMDRWVVADAGRGLLPGAESVADGPGAGPAAGLLGAARHFPNHHLLALACDLPLVPIDLLRRLVDEPGDWLVPESAHGLQPLCARYAPAVLECLQNQVAAGDLSLRSLAKTQSKPTPAAKWFLRSFRTDTLGLDLPDGLSSEALFLNVNRPDDLASVEGLLEKEEISRFLRLGSTKR